MEYECATGKCLKVSLHQRTARLAATDCHTLALKQTYHCYLFFLIAVLFIPMRRL